MWIGFMTIKKYLDCTALDFVQDTSDPCAKLMGAWQAAITLHAYRHSITITFKGHLSIIISVERHRKRQRLLSYQLGSVDVAALTRAPFSPIFTFA